MGADKNGKDLKAGDAATVDCKVTAVNADDTVTVEVMGHGGKNTTLKVASSIVEKC